MVGVFRGMGYSDKLFQQSLKPGAAWSARGRLYQWCLPYGMYLLLHGGPFGVGIDDANGNSITPLLGLLEGRNPICRVILATLIQFINPLLIPGKGVQFVKTGARLKDVHQGEAFVPHGLLYQAHQVVLLPCKAPGYKTGVHGRRHQEGGKGGKDYALWLYLGGKTRIAGRRGLSLCQAVHLIVMYYQGYVYVPSYGVEEMVPTLTVAIPVSGDGQYRQFVVGQPCPG